MRHIRLRTLLSAVMLLAVTCIHAGDEDRVFKTFNASSGLADNSAQTINCTLTGRIVISTIGHINFYDGTAFSHIDTEQEDIYPLSNYSGNYHVYFDKSHHLWLKNTHSVTCVDLLTERFLPEIAEEFKRMGVTAPVQDLFVDADGSLWLMYDYRLHCMEKGWEVPVVRTANLQDIDVYNDSQLLEFYGNGEVAGYDLASGRQLYRKAAYDASSAEKYASSSLIRRHEDCYYQIRNGETEAVLLCFDAKKRQWSTLMEMPYHLNNLVLHDDRVYMACEYGYWTYDLATGDTRHVEELKLSDGRLLQTDVNTIEFDRQGGMWLGTERRGLLYSKPFVSPFVVYSWNQPEAREYALMMDRQPQTPLFPGQGVNCTFRDSRGWTWVGTLTGLRMYTSVKAKPRTFTHADGLLNNVIHSVIEDNMHNIWASTSYGITRLQIDSGRVKRIVSYNSEDNIPDESFVNGRSIKLADGTIVMQALDHVVAFNPANFHNDQIREMKLYPKLIRLMVNGTNVLPGMKIDGRVILEKAITRTREIDLNYNQNSISLTFSGLNYFRPIQTLYRLRVKGYDEKWKVMSHYNSNGKVDSRGMLHLPLNGLRPGKYVVELQASMDGEAWAVEPFQWVIKISEPWWRTTGVYLTLALLALALLGLNVVWYNRNMRLRLRIGNEEGDIIKRIMNFADRCDSYNGEILTPHSAMGGDGGSGDMDMSDDFVQVMLKLVPYLNANKDKKYTMRELAEQADMEMGKLYDVISANLYKSPRLLAQTLRLQRAAEMLQTTELSVEEVAEQCGFVSPNYFIASFYHQYRQTPLDYRTSTPL